MINRSWVQSTALPSTTQRNAHTSQQQHTNCYNLNSPTRMRYMYVYNPQQQQPGHNNYSFAVAGILVTGGLARGVFDTNTVDAVTYKTLGSLTGDGSAARGDQRGSAQARAASPGGFRCPGPASSSARSSVRARLDHSFMVPRSFSPLRPPVPGLPLCLCTPSAPRLGHPRQNNSDSHTYTELER